MGAPEEEDRVFHEGTEIGLSLTALRSQRPSIGRWKVVVDERVERRAGKRSQSGKVPPPISRPELPDLQL